MHRTMRIRKRNPGQYTRDFSLSANIVGCGQGMMRLNGVNEEQGTNQQYTVAYEPFH
jgi:hypothetical protein